MNWKEWTSKIPKQLRNRYAIVVIVFLVWMTFFDIARFPVLAERGQEKKELLEQKEELELKIKENYRTLELLEDSAYLDKFAREQYLMKKPNEDLFVIIDSTKVEDQK